MGQTLYWSPRSKSWISRMSRSSISLFVSAWKSCWSVSRLSFKALTMNEDVNPLHASFFVRDYDLDVPVLLGRGRLKAKYKYLGLPYTVVLDRSGRVVYRWMGYGGAEQIASIRAIVQAELQRPR